MNDNTSALRASQQHLAKLNGLAYQRRRYVHRGLGASHAVDPIYGRQLADYLLNASFSPDSLYVALAFEGISMPDLQNAWDALAEAKLTDQGVLIEWNGIDGFVQRRLLGPLTLLHLEAVGLVSYQEAYECVEFNFGGWVLGETSAETHGRWWLDVDIPGKILHVIASLLDHLPTPILSHEAHNWSVDGRLNRRDEFYENYLRRELDNFWQDNVLSQSQMRKLTQLPDDSFRDVTGEPGAKNEDSWSRLHYLATAFWYNRFVRPIT